MFILNTIVLVTMQMYDFNMDPTNQTQQPSEVLSNSVPSVSSTFTGLMPVSALMESTISLVKSRFLNLAIVSLMGSGVMWLIMLLYARLIGVSFMPNAVGTPPFTGGNSLVGLLMLIPVIILFSGFLYSSLCGVLQTNDVKTALTIGYSRMFVMSLSMIVFLAVLIGSIIFLVLPFVFVYIYGIFIFFITAETGKGGFNALFESFRLVKGRALGVAGRLLLLVVISIVVSVVFSMIFGETTLLGKLVSFFVGVLLQVFMVSYLYVIYTNLKDTSPRPEGYLPSSLSKMLAYGAFALCLVVVFIPALFVFKNRDQIKDLQTPLEQDLDYNIPRPMPDFNSQ